jgi:regulator of protease activity HflC (stomatin/prohibitin superfamily)
MMVLQFGEQEESTDLLGIIGEWWWKVLIALVLIALVASSIQVVSQKTARVVERLGKFDRIMYPGLRFRIPLIEQVVFELSLQIQELREDVKVKTKDNVFVTLPVSVQCAVQEQKVMEAYYELEEPEDVITSLVLNDVKSLAAGMELEDVFTTRDQLAQGVQTSLQEKLSEYGYQIVNLVVDNPTLSPDLEESFNNVMAAQREQDAATARAEALRIQLVGEAQANADGLEINARAQVAYRNTLAEGYAEAVRRMTDGTSLDHSEILRFFMATDGNDAIRDASGKGATVVVATSSPGDALYSLLPAHNGQSVK